MSTLRTLSAPLSQALVAFIIEFDNAFEHRSPNRTTMQGGTGPWLISMVMWSNCMRYVGTDGITVGELKALVRTGTNLSGMQRWRHITLTPPVQRADSVIRATAKGAKAKEVLDPLEWEIEGRWRSRFGQDQVEELRQALVAIAEQIELDLPDVMPILGYGLWTLDKDWIFRKRQEDLASLPLASLMSRVLIQFAVDFERGSELSLAISANILRVLDGDGSLMRDLPQVSGVSKESISMAMGILGKHGMVSIETGAGKKVRLTEAGEAAKQTYLSRLALVDAEWRSRYGAEKVDRLVESLEMLAGDGTRSGSPLFAGLEPYPEGWRAKVRKPTTLPHFPMVLHRGGFPDGS